MTNTGKPSVDARSSSTASPASSTTSSTTEAEAERALNFVEAVVQADLDSGKYKQVVTRFPPEPNGYLHIGHAKSICLNFGLAKTFGGRCHLRFDDTNPAKEDVEFTDSIQRDIKWLGFDWGEHLHFTSDYFEQLYTWAVKLIQDGHAYVCSLNAEQVRDYRGTLTEPGRPSPDRDRSVDENLDLFARMKAGDFEDGVYTLRAKIDMASGNMSLRDPALYRIKRAHHHRTGDAWCIYPMYDFAHGQSDAIEGITHSVCTLEFENNRPLYDWLIQNIDTPNKPHQYEFARLNLNYTVMSKRKLLQLVTEGHVSGWDDPRMLTISGMRRRGYPAEAIVKFCDDIGVSKNNTWIDIAKLEAAVRDELNSSAPRVMAVMDPLKVVITNYEKPDGELLTAKNHPSDEAFGTRQVPFSGELFIERSDFMEDAPKKFFRLAPGREVRLRYAFFIKCEEVIKDAEGNITELRCTYDPETRGGNAPDGRKVKGTLHWVSARHAAEVPVNLYDRLFSEEHPEADKSRDYMEFFNSKSLQKVTAHAEPSVLELPAGTAVQFERIGYFCTDSEDSIKGAPVFNRVVALKDSWAKIQKKGKGR